jgi:antitoxin HigA-1
MMKYPVHPGKILGEDVIEALGLTVGQAAKRLGVSRVTLSRVINGHSSITPNLAVRLEKAGISKARMWLAMQSNYDLAAELEKPESNVSSLRLDAPAK